MDHISFVWIADTSMPSQEKGQYPVPIIEELLDELLSASWFSTLDLCSGFHQI
jgi:hypothetical protein